MFILFYLSIVLVGLYLLSFFPRDLTFSEKISAVFLLGTLLVTVAFFLAYPLTAFSGYLLYLPLLFFLPFFVWQRKKIREELENLTEAIAAKWEISILVLSLTFSALLFLRTIWMDFKTGQLQIAGKLWSDFGAHIPLIKSFSAGFNFPPEYPLFPGEHIRYHFLSDFHFAILEKMGLPLFISINLFSILSFTTLILLIYSLCLRMFHQKRIALLSVILFLFNSSLAYLNLFKKIPLPDQITPESIFSYFQSIILNRDFLAFGPYDQGFITAFWDLNVFTNQRHLAFALAIFLLFLILVFKDFSHKQLSLKTFLLWGIVLGFLPLVHSGIFMIFGFSLPILFLIYPNRRFFLLCLPAILIALPTMLYFQTTSTIPEAALRFRPYYWTFMEQHTVLNFFRFWLYNLGLATFFFIAGFFTAPKKSRLLFAFALTPFLIGNFLSFSPDLNTNHKFFNFSVIIFNFYIAYFIFFLAKRIKILAVKIFLVIFLIFSLTLSGIIDLFPVLNDNFYGLPDQNHVPDIEWITNNTPSSAIFANSYYLYHPASLAGRRIVLGWPYFSWSAGYDTDQRDKDLRAIYRVNDVRKVCALSFKLNFSYVTINTQIKDESTEFNLEFWKKNFPLLYQNEKSGFFIFDANQGCK